MQNWWNVYNYNGSPSYISTRKLTALKEDLKNWNKCEFGDVGANKRRLLIEIQGLDRKEEIECISSEERGT